MRIFFGMYNLLSEVTAKKLESTLGTVGINLRTATYPNSALGGNAGIAVSDSRVLW